MIIRRIELVNYCQHTGRTIDISGNLIAVVGHNGVGKSNFLGALQFALTGEQPGKNKADLLHWGSKEGHVVLEFMQDGKPGRIERSVSSNKVTLEYDGVTTSGITNVAKEMETRLHMDKDLVKQSVFVRQTEIDTIISAKTDKRDREVAFQKLLGIDAARIHKNLTDWLYTAVKPVNYDIQLTEATKRLGELEARRYEAEDAVKAAEKAVAEFGEVDDSQSANLSKAIASVARVLQAKTEVTACAGASTAAAAALRAAQDAAAKGETDPGFDLVTLAQQTGALREEMRKAREHDAAAKAVADAEAALVATEAAPHPTDEDVAAADAEVSRLRSELASVQSEKALRSKSVSVLNGTESTCPVCGKPLDAGMAERLRAEYRELEAKEPALQRQASDAASVATSKRMTLAAWQQDVSGRKVRLDMARTALERSEAPTVPYETAEKALAEAQANQVVQQAYDAKVAGHKKAISDARIKLDVAAKAHEAAVARLAEAEAAARQLCGDEAAADWTQAQAAMESLVAETDRRRRQHTELRMAVARATATRDEIVKTLAAMEASVASLKEAQAEQNKLAERLAVIEHVRDWFHYANGPRVLVTRVLVALTDGVNRLLGNFTALFIVIPDREQVGFKVEFTDGRDRPPEPPGTDVLSGGQRVQLAVAFRLAIYSMFAGKLGLLSLDEPTAYLDEENVNRFGILLTKVREIARNMNTQVFLATHEPAVIPHMDSVVALN